MKRTPRHDPRPGDRLAALVPHPGSHRAQGFTGVNSRTVLALEKRLPSGTTVVYTRKLPRNPCRCSLTAWRAWARGAH